MPVFVKIGFHPTPNVDINLLGTVSAGDELRVENSSGNKVTHRDYDAAPGIGLQAQFRF